MRFSLYATLFVLAGCASSQQLSEQANVHMSQARGAAATGNPWLAHQEQRKAEHDYQRAVARAYDEDRPAPPPPQDPPLPLFDPQLQR
jgi:hypothetical protein